MGLSGIGFTELKEMTTGIKIGSWTINNLRLEHFPVFLASKKKDLRKAYYKSKKNENEKSGLMSKWKL